MNKVNKIFFLVLILNSLLVIPTYAELSYKIEPVNWTDEMKDASVTTYEKGLIIKLAVTNEGDKSDSENNIRFTADLFQNGDRVVQHNGQIHVDYLYLPESSETYFYIPIEFEYDSIGEYKLEISYTKGYSDPIKIEPYPFRFDVVSETIFQERIKETPRPLIQIGDIKVSIYLVSLGGITLIGGLATYLWMRKK